MNEHKLRITAVAAFLMLCGTGFYFAHAQSAVHAGPDVAASRKAEEQFKNIQILKGVPADQIMPGMQFIASSLGVDCQFCHVQDAFDKDDKKPKQIARKMMTMMFAINTENFDGRRQVTCYSCHRGNIHPVHIPAVMAEGAAPIMPPSHAAEPNPASAQTPTAVQLFDKYIQALGGSAALEKTSTRVMKGTITFGDSNIPIDIYAKDPEMRISFTHTPDGDSITAFDGNSGWLGSPNRPPRDVHGQEVDAAAMDADLHFALHLPAMFTEARVKDGDKIADADTYLVTGDREGKPPLLLYFDKNSGLLLRLVRYSDTPVGLLPTQIDYADYRDAGGVKAPFRWTLARTNGRFTIQLSEMKENVPVDDAKFAKPPAPPKDSAK